MGGRDIIEAESEPTAEEFESELLRPLIEATPVKEVASFSEPKAQPGVIVGELIGITDQGRTPLVLYPGQPGTAALKARTIVDLHAPHIAKNVVLMFENTDPARPIIMGVLREGEGWPLSEKPGQIDVDVDGERLIVSAKEELVLRCGKASITLTKAGKVLIKGSYLLSRSSGVNRIKGGSVQLN
jgi:Domain of unknown function (DUF6484)